MISNGMLIALFFAAIIALCLIFAVLNMNATLNEIQKDLRRLGAAVAPDAFKEEEHQDDEEENEAI